MQKVLNERSGRFKQRQEKKINVLMQVSISISTETETHDIKKDFDQCFWHTKTLTKQF